MIFEVAGGVEVFTTLNKGVSRLLMSHPDCGLLGTLIDMKVDGYGVLDSVAVRGDRNRISVISVPGSATCERSNSSQRRQYEKRMHN